MIGLKDSQAGHLPTLATQPLSTLSATEVSCLCLCCASLAKMQPNASSHRAAALRLFPNRFALFPLPPLALAAPDTSPFIRLAENPRISAVDAASPLFAKRFFPPNPNFWSFFRRLDAGP